MIKILYIYIHWRKNARHVPGCFSYSNAIFGRRTSDGAVLSAQLLVVSKIFFNLPAEFQLWVHWDTEEVAYFPLPQCCITLAAIGIGWVWQWSLHVADDV